MKVKICGLTNPDDIVYCDNAGADFLGFIFVEGSPRKADLSLSRIKTRAKKVAVLREPDISLLKNLIPYFDFFQLHGLEDLEIIKFIKREGKKVIKTIFPDVPESVSLCEKVSGLVDFFLVDSSSKLKGFSSSNFSNDSLRNVIKDGKIFGRDFFLGGGLNIWNLQSFISDFSPYGVDVASGVEYAPGKKSFCKVKFFCEIAKGKIDIDSMWEFSEKGLIFSFPSGEKVLFSFGIKDPKNLGLRIDFKVVVPYQKHTDEVLIYPDEYDRYYEYKSNSEGFDGLISRKDTVLREKITFGVKTADCLPVFFVSEDGILGAFHAGWRGLVKGILLSVLGKIKKLGGDIRKTVFVIGPHICGRCYEVGEDVAEKFFKLSVDFGIPTEKFISEKQNNNEGKNEGGEQGGKKLKSPKYLLDIGEFASLYLESIGACVFKSHICVKEDSRFFSRRRGNDDSQLSVLIPSQF